MADVTALGGGRYLVTSGGRTSVVYGVRHGADVWLFQDGRTFVIRERSAERQGGDLETALASPMPASVVGIKVTPGEHVKAGDVLIVLEAMKMELPITAPRDGKVTKLLCAVGELVQPGVPLLEFE